MHLLTYLLTYLHSWLGRIKPAISPKRLKLKLERKLLLTAYRPIKSYTGFISIAAKAIQALLDHVARLLAYTGLL